MTAAVASSRERIQACLQFAQCERLDQVVVGTRIEPGDLVVQRVARGQHQHRQGEGRLTAQLAAQRDTVQARQTDVQDDGIVVLCHAQVQARETVAGVVHLVTAQGQVVPDIGGEFGVVLDEQDAHGPDPRMERVQE